MPFLLGTLMISYSIRYLIPRYLSDNFPKIHSLADSKGRTALHYAAAAESSGGNYYKILSSAVGADKGFNFIKVYSVESSFEAYFFQLALSLLNTPIELS